MDFINEALISCTVQGPCLLHFYGIFWDPPREAGDEVMDYYMISELCEGGDLRRLLYKVDANGAMSESHPRLSNPVLNQLIKELFSGLVYMHQNNVVHRDLKPDNIVLIRPLDQMEHVLTGILKIVDYGHSRTLPSADAAQLNQGVLTANDRGTELYRAPETIASKSRSAQYSTKVDIFSTGLICWEMWHRELPFATLRNKHMRRVEQLIRDGARPEIDEDCPPGLASLIRWCWAPDPDYRPTAAQALEQVMRMDMLSPMLLVSPEDEVFSAVVSEYWIRDEALRSRIVTALHTIMQAPALLGPEVVGHTRSLVAVLANYARATGPGSENVSALVPLEAITAILRKSGEHLAEVKAVLAESDAAASVVNLIRNPCDSPRVTWLVLVLANELAEESPEYLGWSSVLTNVVRLVQNNATDVHMQTASIRFLACVCTNKAHHEATLETDAVRWVLASIEAHPTCAELQAPAVFFLRYAPQVLETRCMVRRSIVSFVRCMEQRLQNVELQGLWVQLMEHLSNNPLGGLEVVKAGATQVVMRSLVMHNEQLTFALMAVKMLMKVAGEPSHATQIADDGAPAMMLTLMKVHAAHAEMNLNCIGVLANLAEVSSIHRMMMQCNAIPAVCELLKAGNFQSNEAILTESCRFLCCMCRNEINRNQVTQSGGPELAVGILKQCLENDCRPPMEFCIEAIYHLAQLHSHRKAVVDSGGITAIVAATERYSEVEVLQKWCLNSFGYFALDGELRKLIVEANGIPVILQTLMQPGDDRIVEQAILAMQHFVFDPMTRRVCPMSDIITVLSRVLRRNCSNLAIMESTVRMLSTIVYHKDCFGLFEKHNIKDTLQSIMDSYPQNAVIKHHGMQAMKSVYQDGEQSADGDQETSAHTVFKTILVGCTNVGKTCIVLRACRNEFSSTVKATLGVHIDFAELEFPSRRVTMQMYDTAGQEQYRALTRNFYRGAHAAFLVYDTTRVDSFEELVQWHEEVQANAPNDVIFAVIGSKSDLEADRAVEPRRAEKWAKTIGAQHFLVSAVANIGITKAFRCTTESLMEQWPSGVPKMDDRSFAVKRSPSEDAGCAACGN